MPPKTVGPLRGEWFLGEPAEGGSTTLPCQGTVACFKPGGGKPGGKEGEPTHHPRDEKLERACLSKTNSLIERPLTLRHPIPPFLMPDRNNTDPVRQAPNCAHLRARDFRMILLRRNAGNSIHIVKFRLCKSAEKNCSEAGPYYSGPASLTIKLFSDLVLTLKCS